MRLRPAVQRFVCFLAAATLGPAVEAQDYTVRCPLRDIVPSITVTGTASAEVTPNIATVLLGVMTERPKAADAAQENSSAVQSVMAEIKSQGIDPKDIKTVSVSLSPVYDDVVEPGTTHSKQVLRGYVARNDLSVRLRRIDKAGAFVARWIERGVNRVQSIDFDFDQKDVRLEGLRVDAVRDAFRKANSYVTGLTVRLGRVLSIAPVRHEARPPAPMQMARVAPQDAGSAIALEPGVETLQVAVDVTWELAQ